MKIQVDIKKELELEKQLIPQIRKEIEAKAEYATKEVLEDFCKELQDYLQQEFADIYTRVGESEFYDRTGEIVETLKVSVSQGGGYFGLKMDFDGQMLKVGITKAGHFNAHADYGGNAVTIDELLEYEEDKKGNILGYLWSKAMQYVNVNLDKRVKVSFKTLIGADESNGGSPLSDLLKSRI